MSGQEHSNGKNAVRDLTRVIGAWPKKVPLLKPGCESSLFFYFGWKGQPEESTMCVGSAINPRVAGGLVL